MRSLPTPGLQPAPAMLPMPGGEREDVVLYTLALVLLILWMLGMVSGYTVGAFVHVLLVIAIVLVVVQLLTGRRAPL